MCPGIKLKDRLVRGDEGINGLDVAAEKHDIAYRNNKQLDSQPHPDKTFEEGASIRVISKDVPLVSERIPALATVLVMQTKLKKEWGI
jgi:hypothetical protein